MTRTTSAVSQRPVLVDAAADQRPRWRASERFHDVFAAAAARFGDRCAVELEDRSMSFRELDAWAHRIAASLEDRVRPGDRVGLLFDRSAHPLAAMLAVSRLGAAWVPLDTAFPADRLAYICGDAEVRVVLTRAHLLGGLEGVDVEAVDLGDEHDGPPDAASPSGGQARRADRTADADGDEGADALAYVIYTSGTTGRPKGVAIRHSSIVNFLRVAAEAYGYRPGDRVYQGLTIAFDFSIEETWVPLAAGATIVPAPPGGSLVGADLARFLADRRVTALCCVPTLLATLDADLPDLRLVLVSGEACPQRLVERWHRPGRRFLNVYGPTETTVTCTWTALEPGEPVTIGVPLPTYRVVVLDPETLEPLPSGATGELAVAGIGLSPGYLGRDDLTEKAFVPDRLGLPDNPSGRLYRTGDLAEIDPAGRIRYRGRIDTQVKVRGYRIELDEIESVLLAEPGVAQAAVTVHRDSAGTDELAAFYSVHPNGPAVDPDAVVRRMRERLPPFMVPAYLEALDALPMLPSHKVDRRALPAPSGPRHRTGGAVAPPKGRMEALLAAAMAEALELPEVGVEADFFVDLGADSLRIARFCAVVRAGGEEITTRAVYEHPTVRALAVALDGRRASAPAAPVPREPHRASRLAHAAVGVAQAGVLAGYLLLLGTIAAVGFAWLGDADLPTAALRSAALTTGALVVLTLLPVAVKWAVVGRWRADPIPAWSLRYLRFWVVREALRLSPARLFVGSPLYNGYLRLLGVRVGRHALVFAPAPVCADLVRIGAGAVVREGAAIDGYRVERGWVLPGPVDVGAGALVGEGSVLDVGTAVGDGAQLAHASALLEGQRVPPGRRWHGSPAVDAGAARPRPEGRRVGPGWRSGYGVLQLLNAALVGGQVVIVLVAAAVALDVTQPLVCALFATGLLGLRAVAMAVVPRAAAALLAPGRLHPLFGVRWAVFRLAVSTGNSRFFNTLFGDSSAVLAFLRAIGVRLPDRVQTGSNFGLEQRWHLPTLCTIGGGSLVSDGLTMPNADYTADGFRVRPVRLGARSFLGNGVLVPPGAAIGDDVLLATKVMVPTDGPVRSGVGLLGSPAFEIPRTVARDRALLRDPDAVRRGLRAKNRHNLVTALLFLGLRFAALYAAAVLVARLAPFGAVGLALAFALSLLLGLALLVGVDWTVRGFRRLAPLTCSLYDPRFWRHERYWKLSDPSALALLDGTPFKPLAWRLLGARIGRMVLDDGAFAPERSMVDIGDHVTLGRRSVLHGHSLEDGAFKSDRIRIGSGVTIGHSALVHYGTDVGDGATVMPDAFLLKGERADAGTVWQGNPAVLVAAAPARRLEAAPALRRTVRVPMRPPAGPASTRKAA